MKTTKQSRRLAKQMFRACLVNGSLDERRAQLLTGAAIEENRRDCLGILSYFYHLIKIERAQHTAQVESAVPLTPDLQARIKVGLTRIYGPGLDTSFAASPSLIGGLRIKVGSDVFDGSIQARLAELEESF